MNNIKHGLRPIAKDTRDYSFPRTFGITSLPPDLPWEYNADAGISIPDQNADGLPMGCTGYTQSELCQDEDRMKYKPRFTYDKTLMMEGHEEGVGCDLRVSLKSTIVYGVQREDETTDDQALTHRRGSYFRVEPINDYFDGIRTALWLNRGERRSVSIGTPWFPEWEEVDQRGIIPATNYTRDPQFLPWHNWKICGWKAFNGVPYLIGKSWQGSSYGASGYAYFSREDINTVLKIPGTGAYTLAVAKPENIVTVKVSIIETLLGYLKMWLKLLPVNQPTPTPTPTSQPEPQPAPTPAQPQPEAPHISRIPEWAEAIKGEEVWALPGQTVRGTYFPNGSRSFRNKNPGNLKNSELVRSFGSVEAVQRLGSIGADPDNFAIFSTYEAGFNALCDFLELACKDELKNYHTSRTLRLFTRTYAEPPNDGYAKAVAGRLGVSIDVDISTFL